MSSKTAAPKPAADPKPAAAKPKLPESELPNTELPPSFKTISDVPRLNEESHAMCLAILETLDRVAKERGADQFMPQTALINHCLELTHRTKGGGMEDMHFLTVSGMIEQSEVIDPRTHRSMDKGKFFRITSKGQACLSKSRGHGPTEAQSRSAPAPVAKMPTANV